MNYLIITNKKGISWVILYDKTDHDLISKYTWHMEHNYVVSNESVSMHRLIMGVTNSELDIDHINRITTDNRRCNLRTCSVAENVSNRIKSHGTTSKYLGVSWFKNSNRWVACIGYKGKQKRIGYFKDEVDAARAYDEMAKKLRGEFATLNFE